MIENSVGFLAPLEAGSTGEEAAIHLRDRRRLLYDHTLPNHTSRTMRAALLVAFPLLTVPAPAQLSRAPATEVAVFAGGCFWGVDAATRQPGPS